MHQKWALRINSDKCVLTSIKVKECSIPLGNQRFTTTDGQRTSNELQNLSNAIVRFSTSTSRVAFNTNCLYFAHWTLKAIPPVTVESIPFRGAAPPPNSQDSEKRIFQMMKASKLFSNAGAMQQNKKRVWGAEEASLFSLLLSSLLFFSYVFNHARLKTNDQVTFDEKQTFS